MAQEQCRRRDDLLQKAMEESNIIAEPESAGFDLQLPDIGKRKVEGESNKSKKHKKHKESSLNSRLQAKVEQMNLKPLDLNPTVTLFPSPTEPAPVTQPREPVSPPHPPSSEVHPSFNDEDDEEFLKVVGKLNGTLEETTEQNRKRKGQLMTEWFVESHMKKKKVTLKKQPDSVKATAISVQSDGNGLCMENYALSVYLPNVPNPYIVFIEDIINMPPQYFGEHKEPVYANYPFVMDTEPNPLSSDHIKEDFIGVREYLATQNEDCLTERMKRKRPGPKPRPKRPKEAQEMSDGMKTHIVSNEMVQQYFRQNATDKKHSSHTSMPLNNNRSKKRKVHWQAK